MRSRSLSLEVRTEIAGHGSSAVEHPHYSQMITFAAITVFTLYVILDVEYPRYGFVRRDQANQLLSNLAESIG